MLYDLNEKENRIYEFICDYMKEKGFSPTVREIGEAIGLKSTSSVHIYLKRLEERAISLERMNVREQSRSYKAVLEVDVMSSNTDNKVYVDVLAIFTKDGRLVPSKFVWEDGREYEITRITDARRAASLKAGGVGMRYTCMVEGKAVHLYYEDDNHWFMEKK